MRRCWLALFRSVGREVKRPHRCDRCDAPATGNPVDGFAYNGLERFAIRALREQVQYLKRLRHRLDVHGGPDPDTAGMHLATAAIEDASDALDVLKRWDR